MFSFLTAPILKYVSGGLLLLLALTVIHDRRVEHLRATYKAQRDESRQLYAKLKTDIVDQTRKSEAANKANVARIETERNSAVQEKANAYIKARDAELALVRERVRARSQGCGSKASTGADAALPQGSVRTSAETELHDAEIGADNTLRLESLIAAWNAAAAVPAATSPAPSQ